MPPYIARPARAFAAALALFCLTFGLSTRAETWRFALIGDTPYSSAERTELPRLLDRIADANVEVIVHVGDIKSGQTRCTDALFADRRALFDAARTAFVLVPGDNDWTDCKRLSNGHYDPLERLDALRALFWTTPHSLGQKRIALERQPGGYPEHSRFRLGPVLFVTLNVPGDDNNRGMAATPNPEFLRRNPAVLDWMADGFALARREGLKGIVFLMQANPGFATFARGTGHGGFTDILGLLRRESAGFDGQVVLVHGDSHISRIDRPLTDGKGHALGNFRRVETHGYPLMGWTLGLIDNEAPDPLRFIPHAWPEALP